MAVALRWDGGSTHDSESLEGICRDLVQLEEQICNISNRYVRKKTVMHATGQWMLDK